MENEIKKVKFLAKLLDSQFEFVGVKFGLDPVINAFPIIGNFVGLALSIYILKIAREIGVSKFDFFRMILNIVLDFIVGAVPIIGVIFDVFLKANLRNIKILEKYNNRAKFGDNIIEGQIIS